MLRSPISVTMKLVDGGERVIHGRVRRFVQMGQRKDLTSYRAEMVPWLWFLSLTSDCKIYQNKSVLEIVEEVFKEQSFSDFEIKTVGSYEAREYCVQYRESHLNFVSRLLQEEGIFYFFEHTKDKHTLVLADSTSSVKAVPNQSAARMATTPGPWQEDDIISSLQHERAVRAGAVTYRDYDFEKPSTQLESSLTGDGEGEVYDYPGGFLEVDAGDRYARIRLEELEQQGEVVRGAGVCRAFVTGHKFDLEEHYRKPVNTSYQLLQVRHTGSAGEFGSEESDTLTYSNEFVAIPAKIPYHPPRTAQKPLMQGSQTAKVVGKSGEEIWVDKHGRVKVQFHWDRQGKNDENSSCWIRVASTWAGKGWGVIQLPRIGQEVIVDFLEGDPDNPIVTGRVYNGEMKPPYALPAHQTQSGIKTRSTKQGGTDNYNEIRFEDNKGKEEILIHAEKDLLTEVENDETRTVGHDRTTIIQNDETQTIKKGNEVLTIDQGDQTVTIKMGDQSLELGQGNQTIVLKMGNQETTLNMGNITTTAKLGNVTTKANVGKIADEALQAIELKCGPSSIKLDPSGVTIKGLQVKVDGSIQTEVKGTIAQINGNAMLKMQGGITMIN
jgi:type VI secretion system secreted protein VgrG